MTDLDRLLDPGYLGDLTDRPLEEIRTMRAECLEVETGLSYLRRMVQGRLDVVGSEQRRRAEGESAAELADLIGQLPEILSEHRRPGGVGRLSADLETPQPDAALMTELEALAGVSRLSELAGMSDAEVDELAVGLAGLEQEVSGRRKVMFDLIDALQAELARRYRDGEAQVDALLE